jgi:hypothetical protein
MNGLLRIDRIAAGLVVLLAAMSSSLADSGTKAPSATITVAGALPRTGAISLPDLQKIGTTHATWTTRGERHDVTGIRLDKLLASFGFVAGTMGHDVPKRQKLGGWRKVVVASAADGFAAVLSCAEMFEEMGNTQALVVWEMDGKPLLPERGPLRLVVLSDKEPARSVYGLNRIDVIDLSSRVP